MFFEHKRELCNLHVARTNFGKFPVLLASTVTDLISRLMTRSLIREQPTHVDESGVIIRND